MSGKTFYPAIVDVASKVRCFDLENTVNRVLDIDRVSRFLNSRPLALKH